MRISSFFSQKILSNTFFLVKNQFNRVPCDIFNYTKEFFSHVSTNLDNTLRLLWEFTFLAITPESSLKIQRSERGKVLIIFACFAPRFLLKVKKNNGKSKQTFPYQIRLRMTNEKLIYKFKEFVSQTSIERKIAARRCKQSARISNLPSRAQTN